MNENTPNDNIYLKKKSHKALKEAYEWLDAVVISIIAIILLFTFVFRIVGIKGDSMENTLFENDRVIISNLFYNPQAGDVIVISRNYLNETNDTDESDSPIIKRVIATEGQEVSIDPKTGSVCVDGQELSEDYIKDGAITTWMDGTTEARSVIVEKDHIFVMGDNRGCSLDSRSSSIGQVDVRYVLGHALFRVYPFNSIGGL